MTVGIAREKVGMGRVHTVTGEVDPGRLGGVLSHEHLLSLLVGPWMSRGYPVGPDEGAREVEDAARFAEDQINAAVVALRGLPALGVGTIVDLSPYGDAGRDARGDNVRLLSEIARRSGINVVSGTATYRAEFSPQWTIDASVDDLARRFIEDATTGIGHTGVRAGILGEQPTSLDTMTPHEEKGLRAAARAHHATGLAISTHTTHGTMALEQVDLLAEEGCDLQRVVIGHMDNHPDLDYIRRVLDRGVNIGFDSIGKQHWDVRLPTPPPDHPEGPYTKRAIKQSDHTRASWLATLIDAGYRHQILLSHDLSGGQVWLNPTTHGTYGYTYLATAFAALLTNAGVSTTDLDILLRDNPARLLSID